MRNWQEFSQDTLRTGAVASVATAVTAAACGQLEEGEALAPLNAVSHIAWGDRAAGQNGLSSKYTLTGIALNTAAVTSWAALHEFFFGRAARQGHVCQSVLGGAAVSALAYVTDYKVVPERLTPGFEKRLSNRSLLGIYAALALSLGLGSLCGRQHSR